MKNVNSIIKLNRLLKEYNKRNNADDFLHDGQKRFIFAKRGNEISRYTAILAHRRWGKTRGTLMYESNRASLKKDYRFAYITSVRLVSKSLSYPIINSLSEENEWGVKFNSKEYVYTWPETKSVCHLWGADQEKFADKVRGQQYDSVIIDEAQGFYFIDLRWFTEQILTPTLVDRSGRMFMQGTPGDICAGFYYDVCVKKKYKKWVVIESLPFENPVTEKQLKNELNLLKEDDPEIENEPYIQREYFGKWVEDNRKNVIKISVNNYLYEWRREPSDRFILGIDIGFNDPSAFVVATENHERYEYLIYLEAFEKKEMLLHEYIEIINEYQARYPGIRIVCDPGGNSKVLRASDAVSSKTLAEELRKHGISVETAEKKDRRMHIERLNSEAIRGLIKIYNMNDPKHPENHPLVKQWKNLMRIYGKSGVEWTEGKPRHLHDGALYARRGAIMQGYVKPEPHEPRAVWEARKMKRDAIANVRKNRKNRLYR